MSNPLFARCFTLIILKEPSIPDAIKVLKKVSEIFEDTYHVSILEEAIVNGWILCWLYDKPRILKDTCINLLKHAANGWAKSWILILLAAYKKVERWKNKNFI